MGYNPEKAVKIEPIPAGEVVEGVIISIMDGKPRDFLKSDGALLSFKNVDEPAINVVIEFNYNGRVLRTEQIFSYIKGDGDTVLFAHNSNMGKYYKQYGHLPKVQDRVKLSSNSTGFFKLIL